MSLPPDTGSVELLAYCGHVRQLLARNDRPDHRQFDAVRLPRVAREVHSGGSGSCEPSPSTLLRSGSLQSKAGVREEAEVEEVEGRPQAPKDGLLSSVIYHDDSGTCIACTVHAVFGPPWSQRPHQGRLNVRVSAPFLHDAMSAGGGFTSLGGYSNAAVATGLADYPLRQVEGYVREVLDGCLDLAQLLIHPAEACWVLSIGITLLNVDGSLRPAALHAAVAALDHLVLPRAALPNGDIVEERELNMICVPVACSFGVLASGDGVRLLADVSAVEERVVDGILTVALDEAGDLVNMQQLGQYPLAATLVTEVVERFASGDAQAIRKRLI